MGPKFEILPKAQDCANCQISTFVAEPICLIGTFPNANKLAKSGRTQFESFRQ